jgi:hypothetical protein
MPKENNQPPLPEFLRRFCFPTIDMPGQALRVTRDIETAMKTAQAAGVSASGPSVDICGYWQGQSGSILAIRKPSRESSLVKIDGEALGQKVTGEGSITGNKLAIRLKLLSEGTSLSLDLEVIADTPAEGDLLSGAARDRDDNVREVRLHRLAPAADGRWEEDRQTGLLFTGGKLDWHCGTQQVQAAVSGRIFGRSGAGELWLGPGRRIHGSFHADHYVYRFVRDCPKEGWWANNYVTLELEMSVDGSFLAGVVKPGLYGEDIIRTQLHLWRSIEDPPRARSLL